MKKIKMRFFSAFTALTLLVSCLCVPAYAEGITADEEYITDTLAIIHSMVKGDITAEQAQIALSYVKTQYEDDSTIISATETLIDLCVDFSDGVTRSGIEGLLAWFELFDNVGSDMYDLWELFTQENGIKGESSIDMHGGNAAIYIYRSDGTLSEVNYFEYGELFSDGALRGVHYVATDYYNTYGEFLQTAVWDGTGYYNTTYNPSIHKLVGDWRCEDGTVSDEAEQPDYIIADFDDVDDDTLRDFLEDLLEELSMKYPDLSTVEGLLRAILAQCESINGKIDSGSGGVDVSELQTMLDSVILSLTINDDENSNALLDELAGIRSDLKEYFTFMSGEESEEGLYTDADIQSIIDNLTFFLNTLFGISNSTVMMSEASVNADGSVSYTSTAAYVGVNEVLQFAIPTVADVRGLGDVGIFLLSKVVDLIVSMLDVVPVYLITGLMDTMHGIMFNDAVPDDLTFIITLADGTDTEFVLLSSSFMEHEGVQDALSIVRALTGFIILYVWLKWCRKFSMSFI